MNEKSRFFDYVPQSPPQGWVISHIGSVMAILKLFTGLQGVSWGMIITFWVAGTIYTLIHTAIRRANGS